MNQPSKYVFLLILMAAPLCIQACRKCHTLEECGTSISFADLTPEMARQLSWGKLPNVAIEIKEGSEFPVKLFAKFGFFSLMQNPDFKINVDRTCYFRFVHAGPDKIRSYISFDMNEWKKSKAQPKGNAIANVDKNGLQAVIDPSVNEQN